MQVCKKAFFSSLTSSILQNTCTVLANRVKMEELVLKTMKIISFVLALNSGPDQLALKVDYRKSVVITRDTRESAAMSGQWTRQCDPQEVWKEAKQYFKPVDLQK